jgi:hypothetical protein
MLHAGLDLSGKRIDICLLCGSGERVEQLVVAPDRDALRTLARRIDEAYREPVCAVIESMTGARLVYDTLEQQGWDVELADAQKLKGLAPLACKTDKLDSQLLAVLSQRELVPAIWPPRPPHPRRARAGPFRLHLVKHKSALKNRVHSTLINFGKPCPVTDLFGVEGRQLLAAASPAALARQHHGERGADRRPRRPDLRDLLRHRVALTRMRSTLKQRVGAILAKHGIQRPYSNLFGPAACASSPTWSCARVPGGGSTACWR